MTLKAKFHIMLGVSVMGLLAVALFWLRSERATLFHEKKQKTQNLVEVPYSMIERQYQLEKEGKVTRNEAQRRAIEIVRTMRYEGGNYFFIIDEQPKMVLHPLKPEMEGQDVSTFKDPAGTAVFVEFTKAAQRPEGGFVQYLWSKPGNTKPVPKLSFVKRFAPWSWVIGTGIYIDDLDAAWSKSALAAAAIAATCLIPLLLISLATSRSISRRLQVIGQRFAAVAHGDLTQQSLEVGALDEIGELAADTNEMQEKLRKIVKSISENAHDVANASEEFSSVSQQISANSEETSAQASAVSSATEEVNRSLQTVATATEEMSASISEIAKNATEAARVAAEAMKTATETNVTVSKLGDSSAEIGQVIKVITSIAQKTDLLALNATVEAARAGEVGAGFAVVANEVKELAKQTATATEDISRKIAAIQTDTKGAVEAITAISQVISRVNEISGTIAAAVEEQSATTMEMSRNLTQAAKGAGQVTDNINGVAEAAQNTSHGATDSQKAAAQLAKMASELRALVDQFKIDSDTRANVRRHDAPSRKSREKTNDLPDREEVFSR